MVGFVYIYVFYDDVVISTMGELLNRHAVPGISDLLIIFIFFVDKILPFSFQQILYCDVVSFVIRMF